MLVIGNNELTEPLGDTITCGERFQKAGEKFSVINGTTPRTVRLSLYGTAGKGQPITYLGIPVKERAVTMSKIKLW